MSSLEAPPPARDWLFAESCLLVALWFSLCGWVLSVLGCLHRDGCMISVILGGIALGLWWRFRREKSRPVFPSFWRVWRKRVRRPLPALFILIITIAALGGVLHPPNNFDALTYRLPQVLHWLDAGRWHWIATSSLTHNITPPGYGWLMAPMLALTHSDRGFFLPNIIAFALLPGSFFSVARGCGVRRRVAWYWMWLLPSGYCFALQAGGIANDLLPASYLLVAFAFAFRARRSGQVRDAWLSILAAALATGVKVVVLPLGLPWLIALAPSWRLLARRPLGTSLVVGLGLAASFLPTAILNTKYSGDWSGDLTNSLQLRIDHPLYGLVANTALIIAGNLAPPICPLSGVVNAQWARVQASPIGQKIRTHYPRFDLRWFELAAEDGAGIGLGIVVLASVTVAATVVTRGARPKNPTDPLGLAVCVAGLIAAVAYGAKMGSEAAPRLFTAYYPFLLIPLLRLAANEGLTRRRWWQALAVLSAASIVPTLVLTPARPLWPAQTVLANLAEKHPDSVFLRRTKLVYDVFATRHDHLAPLKKFIPATVRTIGFVPTGNDLEGSLWRPFGQRRVVEVLQATRSDPTIRQLTGSVVVSSPRGLFDHFQMTAEEFATAIGGRVIGEEMLTIKASVGPEPWCVIAVE